MKKAIVALLFALITVGSVQTAVASSRIDKGWVILNPDAQFSCDQGEARVVRNDQLGRVCFVDVISSNQEFVVFPTDCSHAISGPVALRLSGKVKVQEFRQGNVSVRTIDYVEVVGFATNGHLYHIDRHSSYQYDGIRMVGDTHMHVSHPVLDYNVFSHTSDGESVSNSICGVPIG